MSNYIFLRGLRHVDHTVFAVADGQKFYYEPVFGKRLAYSSGQQVKRSILDAMVEQMDASRAPVVFQWKLEKNKTSAGEDIAIQQLDPRNPDELLGGYMRASGKGAQKEEGEYSGVIKRRSPLSISAMHPIHPLLASTNTEEAISFDRTNDGGSSVRLLDPDGKVMSKEDMLSYLKKNDLNLRKAKFVDARTQRRAYGLYIFDIVIDLRRLFCVSLDEVERELDPKYVEDLRNEGWTETMNAFGKCLVAPKAMREAVIPALAEALVRWRITSNQARTYSPQLTYAVSIADRADNAAAAIRARLVEEKKARLVFDDTLSAKLFVHSNAEQVHADAINFATNDALDKAVEELKNRLLAYDYANQIAVK